MLKLSMVTLGVAAIVVLSTPLAASAASPAPAAYCGGGDPAYANGLLVTVDSPVVSPGATTTVTWSAGYFTPGSSVTISASGNGGSAPTVTVGGSSGIGSATGTADAAGGLVASISVPADASGVLDISAMSGEACGGVSVTIVTSTTPGSGVLGDNVTTSTSTPAAIAPSTRTAASTAALASTGGNLPTVLLVSGGAAVVFGAILIGARTRARRNMQE